MTTLNCNNGLYTLSLENMRQSEPVCESFPLGPGFHALLPELRCGILSTLHLADLLSLRLVTRGVKAYVGQFTGLFASCLANTLDCTRPPDLARLFSVPYHPFKVALQLLFPHIRNTLTLYQLTLDNSTIRSQLEGLDNFEVTYGRFLRTAFLNTYPAGNYHTVITSQLGRPHLTSEPCIISRSAWRSSNLLSPLSTDAIVPLYSLNVTAIGTHVLCAVLPLRALAVAQPTLMRRLDQLCRIEQLPPQAREGKCIPLGKGKLFIPVECWTNAAVYASRYLQKEEESWSVGHVPSPVTDELRVIPLLIPNQYVTHASSSYQKTAHALKPRVVRVRQELRYDREEWKNNVDQLRVDDWQDEYIQRTHALPGLLDHDAPDNNKRRRYPRLRDRLGKPRQRQQHLCRSAKRKR